MNQTERIKYLERHKDLIAGYKRQITQITDALLRAQKRVVYVQTAYDKQDYWDKLVYASHVGEAEHKAKEFPLEIGQMYRIEGQEFTICINDRGVIGIIDPVNRHSLLASKSLETLSEVFWLEFPNAERIF